MYIGEKIVKETKEEDGLIVVTYEDGDVETMSKKMYDAVISEESCDLTALRDKRIYPIVEATLALMRDWGIKISELQYFSVVLNQSLMENEKAALVKLWQQYSPMIKAHDEVDLVTIDRVLKTIKNE